MNIKGLQVSHFFEHMMWGKKWSKTLWPNYGV
jgi:hypothetical protein